ncbi:MAG: NAD(P)/FAD-dependent oxidoreductase [Candidatus Omnitrophica bacterium]|nr:NAD(P)/FAD-dependent oxidoreductase [Candidatus Omnitrophota bacterium]
MNERYDVVIIGAGIGGLVCGCYLAKAGLKILIIEQQNIPGGYCTSFSRRGYRFDVGVHYLGAVKRGVLGKVLNELDLQKFLTFHQFDPTDKIIMPQESIYIRAVPEDTIQEFERSFPDEKKAIRNFFDFILKTDFVSIYSKIKKLTFSDILNEYFTEEHLKSALSVLMGNIGSPADKASALTSIIFLREFILDPGYYPQGGMQALPDGLLQLFEENGGEIIFGKRVEKILTQNNQVQGVIFDQKKRILSQCIVANCDATTLFKDLLCLSDVKEFNVVDRLLPSSSVVALYVAVKNNLRKIVKEQCNIWYSNTYKVGEALSSLRRTIMQNELPFAMICFPSLHDLLITDKHVIEVLINAPYESEEFWREQKESTLEKLFSILKQFTPALRDEDVIMKFGASPCTFERYTANRGGAIYGWASTPSQIKSNLVPQVSSVAGLFLAGHWCTSGVGGEGGISGVANLGRNAARLVMNKLKVQWPWNYFILK